MPYIKPKDPPFVRMQRLLRGYGFDGPTLAAVLDCSKPTALRRIREPETLTLAELAMISSRGHVPMDEIRDAIIK